MNPSVDFSADSVAARRLRQGLGTMRLDLPPELQTRLLGFLSELLRWNAKMNLTAVTEPAAMVERHLLDSLSVLPYIQEEGGNIVDLGCGPGLPGVVIALCRPGRKVVMVDSVAKKIRFVHHAVVSLGLSNAEAVHGRCESLPREQPAALTISRAVASPEQILSWSVPLLAATGRCLVMGGQPPSPMPSVPEDSTWQWTMEDLSVPGLESRCLLIAHRRD